MRRPHRRRVARPTPRGAFVRVADDDRRTPRDATLRGCEADAGTGRRGHEHPLADEQAVRGWDRWSGRDGVWGHGFTLGSGGRPRTRSPMMLRWIWLEPP